MQIGFSRLPRYKTAVVCTSGRKETSAKHAIPQDHRLAGFEADFAGPGAVADGVAAVVGRRFFSNKAGYTDKFIFLPAGGRLINKTISSSGTSGHY